MIGRFIIPQVTLLKPFLDKYPGAAAAYSLRKLRNDYQGCCIKIRRSSDDELLDIGFTGGLLDENAITTFIGNVNAYVHTWYDQSGNAINLSSPTGEQPFIAVNGIICRYKGKPCISFDGVNDGLYCLNVPIFKNVGNISMFTISRYKSVPTTLKVIVQICTGIATALGRATIAGGYVSGKYLINGRRLDANAGDITNSVSTINEQQKQLTAVFDYENSNKALYIDGALDVEDLDFQTSGLTSDTNSIALTIGGLGGTPSPSNYSPLEMSELIIYNTNQEITRDRISTAQKAYYSTGGVIESVSNVEINSTVQ